MNYSTLPEAGAGPVRALLIAAMTVFLPWPAIAATILVDSLEDNQGALDACSLRAAIINANNDDQSGSTNCLPGDGFDSITFAAKLENETIEMNGTALPVISDSLSIQGPVVDDASSLSIDARGLSRIVRISDIEPVTLMMNGITLTGGRTSADGVLEGGGAALLANASEIGSPHVVVLDHVRLTGNSIAGDNTAGGAVLAINTTVTLDGTEVFGNWTEGESASGGAFALDSASQMAMFDSRIADNTVEGEFGMGGGVFGVGASVAATDSEIVGNSTKGYRGMGGGILLDLGGELTLTRSKLSDNATTGEFGSGGSAMVLGTVDMIGSEVTGNATDGDNSIGGGICVGLPPLPSRASVGSLSQLNELDRRGDTSLDEVRLSAIDSTISDNSTSGSSSHGGGIAIHERAHESGDFPGILELDGTTVANNSTTGPLSAGGGVAVLNSDVAGGVAALRNVTLSDNAALGMDSSGGAIVASRTGLSLLHATVAFNKDSADADSIFLAETGDTDFELSNSLIVHSQSDANACSHTVTSAVHSLASDNSCTGHSVAAKAIALEPLQDNGGRTPTHAPADSSLAINAAGDCVDEQGVTEDQRGKPRPGGESEQCDIGALERQNPQSDDTVFADRFVQPD